MSRAQLIRAVRLSLPIFVLVVIALGPVFHLVYGSICTISIGAITLTCPLGFLQVSLASRSMILGLLVPVAVTLAVTILLGRAFCGWICPAGDLMQRFGEAGLPKKDSGLRLTGFVEQNSMRLVLLGSVLTASAIFRYPVFCVVCPIGIICRNVISLFQNGSVGLDLLFIPVIAALELGLAPWCSHICPLGMTLRILGRKSPLVPMVNRAKCITCSICAKVCNMRVELPHTSDLEDCSKCMECSLRCPTKAIEWRNRVGL